MIEKIMEIEPVIGFGILIATTTIATAGWVTQWWRNRKAITVRAYIGSDPNWLRSPQGVATQLVTGFPPLILSVTGTNNGAAGVTIICGYAKYGENISMVLQHETRADVVLPNHGQRAIWHAPMDFQKVASISDIYLMDTNHKHWKMSTKELKKFKSYVQSQFEKAMQARSEKTNE